MMTKSIHIVKVFILLTFLCFACNPKEINAPRAVNPDASPETRALLKFLYEIKGKYTLSGQHNYIGNATRYDDSVKVITGKLPVVWGSDFSFCIEGDSIRKFWHPGVLNLTDPSDSLKKIDVDAHEAREMLVENAKKMHAQGHIITLMWHNCFPSQQGCCKGESVWALNALPDQKTWDELVTDGTMLNSQWKSQVDEIAGYLKELRDCNVPVIWRPYHEMNGQWFWWGDKKGENGFKKLYIMMYDHFTRVHKLNNLLWVFDANAPRDRKNDTAYAYSDYYPGDEYVDILAADVYRKDYNTNSYNSLLNLANGKPIALGEIGEFPSIGDYEAQNQWEWFMEWGFILQMGNKDEAIRAIYNHPRTLTLDEVESDGKGGYRIKKQLP